MTAPVPALVPADDPVGSLWASPAIRLLAFAAVLCVPLVVLAVGAAPADRPVWDNLQWSISAVAAVLAAAWSVRGTTGNVRVIRTAGAAALGLWAAATLAWAWMNLTATVTVPSISDALIVAIALPAVVVVSAIVHRRLSVAEEAAVYLDGALAVVFIGSLIVVVFGPTAVALPEGPSIAAMLYPTGFLGLAAAGLIALLAVGQSVAPRSGVALLAGFALIGLAYLGWIGPMLDLTDPGELSSVLFTFGTLIAGFGVATWRADRSRNPRYLDLARTATRIAGPVVGGILFLVLLLPTPDSIDGIIHALVFAGAILLVIRQALIVRERTSMLATVTELTETNQRLVGELRHELDERRRAESSSIDAARATAVGALSSSFGHEVNNPLTGVLGYAELVLAELPLDHPSRRDVETIREEALRARHIVSSLRDFADPQSPLLAETDLNALVEHAAADARKSGADRAIRIEVAAGALEPMAIDADAVRRAMDSVLANAVQATPPGGVILVATVRDGREAVISVSDDGPGMDEATLRLAPEPFFTHWPPAADETATAEPAAGLGLSIANGLIGSHGGKITLRSEPDRGTTVEIRLPVAGVDR